MDCLIDQVEIAGCGATTSSFLINQLPGIDLPSIENLANADQLDYTGVWSDVQTRAARKFKIDVYTAFAKRYKLAQISATYDLDKVIDTTSTTTAAAEYRGIYFDLDYPLTSDDWKVSALQSHYIQTINFYSPAVKTGAQFKIWNYDTNTVVDTFTQTLAIGWNAITVNESYPYRRIVVATDSTTFNSVELELPGNLTEGFPVQMQGVNFGLAANVQDSTKGNNTFGMSAIYGVRCKYDTIVCNNIDLFIQPWMLLLGSELTLERMHSTRINKWTIRGKQAEDLKAYYDVEYQKALEQTIDSIDLNLSDSCLECDAMYNLKEMPV